MTPSPAPILADTLRTIPLTQAGLSGEIGRRIADLIRVNYLALDLGKDFVEAFRSRPFTEGQHYIGVGKVIDAGSQFAAYTGDPAVRERNARLIADVWQTRDADEEYLECTRPPKGRAFLWRHKMCYL